MSFVQDLPVLGAKKNALSVIAQDVSGSPPPELPNHTSILCPIGHAVNVTCVIASQLLSTAAEGTEVTNDRG
jgi:hypothetical protein